MKEHLENRIAYLRKVELEYFDKQYEYPEGHFLRRFNRQSSNEFHARRLECEELLKFLNDSASEGN